MATPIPAKTGVDALLTPENVLLLIDHQPFQFVNLHSHEPTLIVNNVIGLAKTAKAYGVPTILTTVLEERGGLLIKGLQDVFPDQKPIPISSITPHFLDTHRRRKAHALSTRRSGLDFQTSARRFISRSSKADASPPSRRTGAHIGACSWG